jgi:hypothetical protein
MRAKLLISFLIIALLTAGNPAPQLDSTTGNPAAVQTSRRPIPQLMFILFPNPTGISGPMLTSNAKVSPGCLAPKGLRGRTAPFKIEVFGTKKANVNINGTSRNGNYVIYCSFVVKQGIPAIIELMWGNYVYLVARGTKTTRGSFFINTSDKATMQVYKDKIKIGPYP